MKQPIHAGILFETFAPVHYDEIKIIQESETNGTPKVKFKVRLQTLEEKNQNGRYYDVGIGREIAETLLPKAQKRSLFMEVDHPMVPQGPDENFARRRAVTIEYKNCGALLSDIHVEGKEIVGIAETMSGFLGPDLYKTIVYDKADIGFSLRMFGRVQLEESTGLNRIVRPIRPITYDVVTNPSHASARILEFVTENISDLMLNENLNEELLTESCLCCDGICLPSVNENTLEYLETVLNSTFKRLGPVSFRL